MKKLTAFLMAVVVLMGSAMVAVADSHNWNSGELIQFPTCKIRGRIKYTCTNPGCTAERVEEIGTRDHVYLAPTCTEKAKCQWCPAVKKGSKELGHVKPEPACVPQKCGRVDCDKTYPAKDNAHHFLPATCEEASKCRDCPATQGQKLGHSFAAATCTAPATCENCGKTEGTKKAHAYLPATCSQLATCKYCRATTGTYKEHNFQNGKCTACNKPQYALDDEPNEEDDLMVLAAQ